uniref:Uncharacterized protein n=1 Tax=Anopheles melas TaxID=34690 RepID=A0A182TT39_9DIPT
MDERAVQDASCVKTQQQLGETSSISPERRMSVVEDAANKDESASQPARLPRDLEVRRKRLEIRRKQFELEKVQKELELELCELDLEEEISDRGSHVSGKQKSGCKRRRILAQNRWFIAMAANASVIHLRPR